MKTRERIALDLIDDNPWQPREAMDPDAIAELAESIYQLGLLQAPLGRGSPTASGRIQAAFGHRRVAGCRLLHQQGRGESYIDMDIAEISDEMMAVMALTENEGRKQLSQIEVVRAHKRAVDETELSVQTLAEQLGMNRPTLANNLRVLELPDSILEHVESGALGLTVAREFLVFQTATHAHIEDMREVIRRIVNVETYGRGVPNWSRRHVRKLISERVAVKGGEKTYHWGSSVRTWLLPMSASKKFERPNRPVGDRSFTWTSARVSSENSKSMSSNPSGATRVSGDSKDAALTSNPAVTATWKVTPVVGQGKCPGKCSAKMSLRYAAMVSDVDGLGTIRCFHPGGPPASR